MKVTTLISTMNQENYKNLLDDMNIQGNYVIINQITDNSMKIPENYKDDYNSFVSYNGKGLSKSRNQAINETDADICVIADDDMYYVDGYCEIIKEAYTKYEDADIIAFVVEHEDKRYEKKIMKEGKISYLKSMKISSVQMTIKKTSIVKNNIRFDENFGAGSKYYMGEENIFLFDCLKKGLKIYYIPIKIATLRKSNSTWFKGHTREHYNNSGAVYYRMSRFFYPFFILQFVIRKREYYGKELSSLQVLRYMFEGVKKYKRGSEE